MVLAMVFRHKRTGQLAVARMETTAIDLAHSEAHAWFLAGDPKAIANNTGLFNAFFNDQGAWETAKLTPLALPEHEEPKAAEPEFAQPISGYEGRDLQVPFNNTVGGTASKSSFDGPGPFGRHKYD